MKNYFDLFRLKGKSKSKFKSKSKGKSKFTTISYKSLNINRIIKIACLNFSWNLQDLER